MLAVAAALLYLRSTGNGLVQYDDPLFVTVKEVRKGFSVEGVQWAFSSRDQRNWIPLTRLSWLAQHSLFGGSPGALHWVSLGMHAAGTVLAAWAWRRQTGSHGAALWAGAVFAFHPLQVEAVSWATAQKDGLATLGAFAALGWAARDNHRPWLASVAFVLSLLAKPAAVLLPFYVLAVTPGNLRERLARHWLLLAVLLAYLPGMLWAKAGQAEDGQAAAAAYAIAFWHAPVAFLKYLSAFIWPQGLCYAHPLPPKPPVATGLASAATISLALWLCWRVRPRSGGRLVWQGLLWFVAMFAPASGILAFGPQGWAERFGYIGITGLAVAIWPALRRAAARPRWLPAAACVSICILSVWAVLSYRQQGYWRNSEVLFQRALQVERPSPIPHFHIAVALESEGRRKEAAAHLGAALEIDPGFTPALYNHACICLQEGRAEEALRAIREVVSRLPDWAEAHLVMANSLFRSGDQKSALAHYEEAERLKPGIPTAAANAAILRRRLNER